MPLTRQQKADIARLRDNEMLTGNLTDAAARAVLDWAEAQIVAGVPYESVLASLKSANRTETEDPALALAAATTKLASIDPSTRQAFARRLASDTVTEAVDMEARPPLPTSPEGPDDARHDAPLALCAPPTGTPFKGKPPLATTHESPDDDDDGSPTQPPSSPISRK